jgi:hypothetical protein
VKNKILCVTRNSVPYVKELRPYCGSVTACLLMQQLDFRFNARPNGFFKFLEPCTNQRYREGDSWCEELAFSKDEFRSAFDRLGVRHKSKSALRRANDRGEAFTRRDGTEAFYCSYHDNQTGATWYFRNHPLVDKVLDEIARRATATADDSTLDLGGAQ